MENDEGQIFQLIIILKNIMKKQNAVIGMVVVLILISGAFYGGMQYGLKSVADKAKAQFVQGGRNFGGANGNSQRLAGGANQNQGGNIGGQNMRGGADGGGGFITGQITSKDDTSITIKTNDGGSRIVFFSEKTGVDKSVSGASSDLSVGQQIMINGKTNADGSVVAQAIQIRPAKSINQPAQ